jgi:hypothetical protein
MGLILVTSGMLMLVREGDKTKASVSFVEPPVVAKKIRMRRIALMCSITEEIQADPRKIEALKLFCRSFMEEVERAHYGINFCGAPPLREVLLDYYCEKLRLPDIKKEQMEEFNKIVRWYWYKTDTVGFNFEPAYFESHEMPDAEQRTLGEVADADIIVVFTGRTGTRLEIEKILRFHKEHKRGVDLEHKPLILLGWFGGSVKAFMQDPKNQKQVQWVMRQYSELVPNPSEEVPEWWIESMPKKLAKSAFDVIHTLIN